MAEAYFQPGKQCFGPSENPDTPEGWRAFCDCMYLKPVEVAQIIVNGSPVTMNYPLGVTNVAQSRADLEAAVAELLRLGHRAEVRSVIRNLRTPVWEQCVRVVCAAPGGCAHPADSTIRIPFDVAPGLLAAPWTDVGAGARRIPKKDAGIAYDIVGTLFSLDPKDYTPLALWSSFFRNQAKFLIDSVKVGVFAPQLTTVAVAMLSNPAIGVPLMLPFVAAQCAAEGKDFWGYVVRPALMGTGQNLVFALRGLGTFLSGRYFELSGAVMAKFAEDQIATQQINSMSPPMAGMIRFFAQYGEELGRRIQDAVTGGLKLESAPDVMSFLANIFTTLSQAQGMPEQGQAMFRLMAKAMQVAAIIARGLKEQWPFERIVDSLTFEVFGFSLSEVKRTILAGPAAIVAMFNSSQSNKFFTSPQDALNLFNSINAGFTEIVKVVNEANKVFDGTLAGFARIFEDAKMAFAGAVTPVEQAVHMAVDVQAGRPVVMPPVSKTNALPAPSTSLSARPGRAMASSGAGVALLGAGAGFVTGGPLGAALGAVVGLALRPKMELTAQEKKILEVKEATTAAKPIIERFTQKQSAAEPTERLRPGPSGFADFDAISQGKLQSTWKNSPELQAQREQQQQTQTEQKESGPNWLAMGVGGAAVGILTWRLLK